MVSGDLGKFAAKPIARRVRLAAPFTNMIRDTVAPGDGIDAASGPTVRRGDRGLRINAVT